MTVTHEAKALAIIPRSIAELVSLAELLAKSDLLPKALRGKVPDVAMAIMAGQEMGLTPMASLRNFHVIEGKPVLSADAMVALALGSGLCVYFRPVEESAEQVTYETMRVGDDKARRCTWTKQMSKDAGLNTKDNWRTFPRQMLAARAKSELARNVYPDVLAGCVSTEEHADWRPPIDAIDAEFVDRPAETEQEPAEFGAIDRAETEDALKLLAPTLKKLPEKWAAKARTRYQERLVWCRSRAAEEAAGAKSQGVVAVEGGAA